MTQYSSVNWIWLGGRYDINSLKTCDESYRILTANSELNNQIRDLKDTNRNLLQRIEALENKTGEWTPQTHTHTASVSDITALANTVAEEMQARKDKELNLVIYGIQESAATTDEEMETDDKNSVCDVLNSLQVPTMNVTNVFRMGRKLSSHGHVHWKSSVMAQRPVHQHWKMVKN